MVCTLHQNVLKEQVARTGFASIQYRAYPEILRSLGYGEPRLSDIANVMHMSEQYLANSALSLMEVSQLLGFLDLSNFYRATKRWFGLPPGKYRNQLEQQSL